MGYRPEPPSAEASQTMATASPAVTGFTVNVPAGKEIMLITPAGAYASGTINLPPKASLYDGQLLEVTITQAVTLITFLAVGVASLLFAPTALVAGQTVRFRYFLTIDAWVRV